ncbi:serine/threonine-protein kinase Bck1p/SLK1/SSP31 [[Candida] anglica]|uniref:mitogen-activated protein kinase kinase kinase n=1 Tax=[Candida] anglica TaxID=148631 RepID=A0ABP0EJ12_9ASCO
MARRENRLSVNYESRRIQTPTSSESGSSGYTRVASDGVIYTSDTHSPSTYRNVSEPEMYNQYQYRRPLSHQQNFQNVQQQQQQSQSSSSSSSQPPLKPPTNRRTSSNSSTSSNLPYPEHDYFDFSATDPSSVSTKKPSHLTVNTFVSPDTNFSFSEEQDMSLNEFQVSPTKGDFDTAEPSRLSNQVEQYQSSVKSPRDTQGEGSSQPHLPLVEVPEFSPSSDYSQSNSPTKSTNSNTIGSIIGGYNYSGTSIESSQSYNVGGSASNLLTPAGSSAQPHQPCKLRSSDRLNDLRLPSPETYESRHDGSQLSTSFNYPGYNSGHARNSSGSSTVSTSSQSTLVPSSKDKRFVRYVMNTSKSSTASNSKWNMKNVLRWLDSHNFNQSWKDTFKRNELSGNRFLELCNYEIDSMVWRQFGKFLVIDSELNSISRFITLLKLEVAPQEQTHSQTQPSSYEEGNDFPPHWSRKSSSELNPSQQISQQQQLAHQKAENRKSTPIFQKHFSGSNLQPSNFGNSLALPRSTSGSASIGSSSAPIKQRPFSYINPSTSKVKDSPQAYKFFRKHNRTSSTDSPHERERERERDYSSTPNSAIIGSSHEFPMKKVNKPATSISLNDDVIYGRVPSGPNGSSSAVSSGNGGQATTPTNTTNPVNAPASATTPTTTTMNTPSSKKDRLLSTFRKYGGDRAAGMVKHGASSRNSIANASKGQNATSSSLDQVSPLNMQSNLQHRRASDNNSLNSHLSSSSLPIEKKFQTSAKSIHSTPEIEISSVMDPIPTTLDEKYLPKPKHTGVSKPILVSKDNHQFFPVYVKLDNISEIQEIRQLVIKTLDLIDIGLITFHLTEIGSDEGLALPEEFILNVLQMHDLPKFVIKQELSSPSVATLSTTSSDSKSFELKGENNDEKFYPATPQYLLQNNYSSDSKIDYWNFKEVVSERLPKIQASPNYPTSIQTAARLPHVPLKLEIPHNFNKDTEKQPTLSINTKVEDEIVEEIINNTTTDQRGIPTSSFRVLRKEGREIDFDKRRKSPFEAKAPKLIPNIYSSSVGDSLKSPITATTVSTLKDNDPSPKEPTSHLKAPPIKPKDLNLSLRSRSNSRNSTRSIGGDSIGLDSSPKSNNSIIAKRAPPPPPNTLKRSGSSVVRKSLSRSVSNIGQSSVSALSQESLILSTRSNSSSDRSMSFRRATSRLRGGSVSRKSTMSRDDEFKQNEISFEEIPDDGIAPNELSDEDDFFVKPVKSKDTTKRITLDPANRNGKDVNDNDEDDEEDDDFFMKPIEGTPKPSSKMNVRPPIDVVYSNLEKYFPNTNLDKPIIDDTPLSPVLGTSAKDPTEVTNSQPMRKPTISRTFSNANISPSRPTMESDNEYFGESQSKLSRRRMKTIRIVANEARRKRLEQQAASPYGTYLSDVSRNNSNLIGKAHGASAVVNVDGESGGAVSRSTTSSGNSVGLFRTNTKMWGQRVVEVTSTEIEKGFVSKIRNNKNGQFEEFAWIKGELIGRGSFGAVYIALNVTTGEMLAVKQVVVPQGSHKKSSKTLEGIEALHKEVETMKDLDHINIVQYLGFEQKGNVYSLFLEYVAGGSIALCMKSYGPFEEGLIRFITRQVLLGLEYLHSNGILHRDLKADNLLLEVDGRCKISDFGISKKSSDIYANNAEMSMQGTIFWMAPEVIDSIVEDKRQGYSAKIDIWSLGCVVLEMFAGKRPWSNEAVVSAIYKIGKTKLAPPIPEDIEGKISPEAKDFINQCFTINPEKRPTVQQLLHHDFMRQDTEFVFEDTKLAQLIKFNSRKSAYSDKKCDKVNN